MIPGQWEPRRSSPVTPPPSAPAILTTREAVTPIKKRREQATWLEVSICVAALLATMLFAMWAARLERRVTMRFDRSEDLSRIAQLRAAGHGSLVHDIQ